MSPGDNSVWEDDGVIYSGCSGGGFIEAVINYWQITLKTSRSINVQLFHNPFRVPELDRDFIHAQGGDPALASAAGNIKASSMQLITTNWFWGLRTEIPPGYTEVLHATITVGADTDKEYSKAYLVDPPLDIGPVGVSLLGVKPDAGTIKHYPLQFSLPPVSLESDQFAAIDLTDFILEYLKNKDEYSVFELLPIITLPTDLGADTSPQKMFSLWEALTELSITWTELFTSSTPVVPVGTARAARIEFSGISTSTLHAKYSGVSNLPASAHIPPRDIPPLD